MNIRLCPLLLLIPAVLVCGPSQASGEDVPKLASPTTEAANKAVGELFDLAGSQDFEDARRGLVARLPDNVVRNAKGDVVWDGRRFTFIQGSAPASVNPSLWRQEKLNNEAGLFMVTDDIWQIRGYDAANMSLVAGKTGWIVIDPLMTPDVARATLDFAMQHLGRKPVVAVIYTHSHFDHFGGVRGVVEESDVNSGKVKIIAPEGFMEHAIAENVLAGNAMSRRAQYQAGAPLVWGQQGAVGGGLGKTAAIGVIGLLAPTDIVRKTGEERLVDGVRIIFQMTNGSEAPSEFAFYFPELKALCLSEVVTANMHNIYTLRGAKTRDALAWSKYINESIDMFPETQVAFRSHHWPVWTPERIRKHLVNQRDMYRYIHDAALHMANQGAKMNDIGNATYFPKGLANDFSTHGYYGTLSHNLRAVYDFYLGYYDANPAHLNPLPVQEASKRYVEAIGGIQAIMDQAKKAFEAGDYRWAAELNNHAVFADPGNEAARLLQADILEQMGYQAESGVWRNVYLTGAKELRDGPKPYLTVDVGPDVVRAMTVEMIFDYLAVRLDHQKVDGLNLGINVNFTDSGERYALELSNAVLNNTKGRVLKSPNATLNLTRPALMKMLLANVPLARLVETGEAKLDGDGSALGAIFANVRKFDPMFNIVTPQ